MAPPGLFENRNGADAGCSLQDRYDRGVPYFGQRIGPPPATQPFLLRGQPRIILDPERVAGEKPALAAETVVAWVCRKLMYSLIWCIASSGYR